MPAMRSYQRNIIWQHLIAISRGINVGVGQSAYRWRHQAAAASAAASASKI